MGGTTEGGERGESEVRLLTEAQPTLNRNTRHNAICQMGHRLSATPTQGRFEGVQLTAPYQVAAPIGEPPPSYPELPVEVDAGEEEVGETLAELMACSRGAGVDEIIGVTVNECM